MDKWVAIITSGYDEDAARTGRIAAVNFPDGAKETIWQEGDSIVNELETQTRSGASLYYSLTSPVGVDADNDGYLDLIFAGDTEGSLWKFYYDYDDTIWKRSELFHSGGQPITARPTVAFDDQQNLRIYFGTGKYLIGKDKENTSRNAYYCIIEKKYETQNPNDPNHGHFTNVEATPLGPGDLADVTSFSTKSHFNNYVINLTEAERDAFQRKYARGWYFQLEDPGGKPGERVMDESSVVDGVVFFTSFTPDEDICDYGGEARLYAVDYKTGTIATSGGDTALAAEGGGEITERYRTLGPGFPSRPAYHKDFATGLSSVLVQTNDATVHVEKVNLTGKLWQIGSWRYVD